MTTTTAGHSIGAPETARRLGISVRTLDRMGDPSHPQHLAPVSRIGGYRKYDAAQVERVRLGLPAVERQQEPACRWAHGEVADLDDHGRCAVCAP